jgi:hypothetical protein
MKTKFNCLLIATICYFSVVYGQATKPEMINGTWKLKSLKAQFPANISEKEKAKDQKIIDGDEADFKKYGFTFKGNALDIGKKHFTWMMNEKGTQVTVKKKGKSIIIATLVKVTAHQLIFTRPDEGMIVTFTLSR